MSVGRQKIFKYQFSRQYGLFYRPYPFRRPFAFQIVRAANPQLQHRLKPCVIKDKTFVGISDGGLQIAQAFAKSFADQTGIDPVAAVADAFFYARRSVREKTGRYSSK